MDLIKTMGKKMNAGEEGGERKETEKGKVAEENAEEGMAISRTIRAKVGVVIHG